MLPRFPVFFLAALMLSACSTTAPVKPVNPPPEDYAYAQRYLAWLIAKEMADNDVTGLSIALVDDQRLVWASGFGYSDAENKVPATPKTPYRMSSIAKLLTASAAMQMAERGQMEIDRPLSRYLPKLSIKSRFSGAEPITPRNIMSHHSGLPYNFLKGMVDKSPRYFTTLVEDIKDEYVAYPPNFIWAYSNLGMTLLGAAIEQTSGQDYGRYIEQSFFQPLGMQDSYFASQPAIKGYRAGKLSEPLSVRDLPSGGLVSTVLDLGSFMKMVFADGRAGDRQILKPESLAEMFRPQNTRIPLDINLRVGLGWMLSGFEVENGGVVAGHWGSLLDFNCVLITLPEHKLGVVVASNSASARSVVDKVAAEALKLLLEAKTGIAPPAKHKTVRAPGSLTSQSIDAYTGYFDTVVGLVKVSNRFGDLNADVMGRTFQLPPQSDGWFGVKYKFLGLIPISVSALDDIHLSMNRIAGRDVLVGRIGNETTVLGEKLRKSPDQKWLMDYVGKYELMNPDSGPTPAHISLQNEDGMFIGECTFAEMPGFVLRVGINPVSDTEAVISGLGSGRGETIRMAQDGTGKRIFFSGFELRKMD
jgi:CubicO group peptidase (beta-lactamase class C family)